MRSLLTMGIAAWGVTIAPACPRQAPDSPEQGPPPAPEVSIPEPVPEGAGLVVVSEFPEGMAELWQTGPLGEIAGERARAIGDEVEGILNEHVGIRVAEVDRAFFAFVPAGAGEPEAVLGLRGAEGELATPGAGARAEVPLHEAPGRGEGVMAMEGDWFLAGDEGAVGPAVDVLAADGRGLDREGALARVVEDDVGRAYFAIAADAAGAEALDPGGELDELARSFEVDAAALSLDEIDLRLVARGGDAGLERLNEEIRAEVREPAEAMRAMRGAGGEGDRVIVAVYQAWLAGQLESLADELEPRVRDGVLAASAPIGDIEPAAWARAAAMWGPLGYLLLAGGPAGPAPPPEASAPEPPEEPAVPKDPPEADPPAADPPAADPPAADPPAADAPDEETRELQEDGLRFMMELAEVGARHADDCDEVERRWRDVIDDNEELLGDMAALAADQTPAEQAEFEDRYEDELAAIINDMADVLDACMDHEGVLQLLEEVSTS